MSNSFSAADQIYITGFNRGQTLSKKNLEITTFPGNDLRRSCDVAQYGAELQKKVIASLAVAVRTKPAQVFPRHVAFVYSNKDSFAVVSCVLSNAAILPKLIKNCRRAVRLTPLS